MYKKGIKCLSITITLIIMMQNFLTAICFATSGTEKPPITGEFRGIWVSFLDLKPVIYQKTEEEFKKNFDEMVANIKNLNLTDVIIQVRPFSDSLCKSSIFPQSHFLTGKQGLSCGYDPFEIMVEKCHQNGLRIHAWVNPYRVKNPNSDFEIAKTNPVCNFLRRGKSKEVIALNGGGLNYNPASHEVRELIVNGIKEIAQNYQVDGIHLDDYFYPSTDMNIDDNFYADYKNAGGTLPLNEWRMENVNTLVKSAYSEVKKINPQISFGISPSGMLQSNYEKHYSDVKRWLIEPGYIDYLCPQIYFGFKHENCDFNKCLNEWGSLPRHKNANLYVGLAAYKIGEVDKWALSGSDEWVTDKDVIYRQIVACRKNNNYKGFALFRYNNLVNPAEDKKTAVEKALVNIKEILKK